MAFMDSKKPVKIKGNYLSVKAIFFLFLIALLSIKDSFADKTIELKWGDILPTGTPSVKAMKLISEEVKEKTNGKVIIKLFPSGQLGSSREMIESAMFGSLDMVTEGAGNVGQWIPSLSILEAPYLWRDINHIEKVINGPIGERFQKDLKGKDLKMLGFFYNGIRHITTSRRPINSINDIKNLKLRVPENEIFLSMVKAWGAKPTPLNFSELYLALRQNVVEGQENPLPLIEKAKLYEVQKFLILTGHIITPRLILINDAKWSRIGKGEQEIIMEALGKGVSYNNEEILSMEKELIEKFGKSGMTVIKPDKKEFKDAIFKTLPAEFEQRWGKGLFEEIAKTK